MGPEEPSLTGGGDRARFLPIQPRRVAPEALEIVERALVRTEDVHDHVDVVQEPPAGVALALSPCRADSSCSRRARSISSTTDLICRVDVAVQITKWSVITISSLTSRTTMSWACFEEAARAAAAAVSRLGGIVPPLRCWSLLVTR